MSKVACWKDCLVAAVEDDCMCLPSCVESEPFLDFESTDVRFYACAFLRAWPDSAIELCRLVPLCLLSCAATEAAACSGFGCELLRCSFCFVRCWIFVETLPNLDEENLLNTARSLLLF